MSESDEYENVCVSASYEVMSTMAADTPNCDQLSRVAFSPSRCDCQAEVQHDHLE